MSSSKRNYTVYSCCGPISSNSHTKILFYNPFIYKNIGFISFKNFCESASSFSVIILDSCGKRMLCIDPDTTYTTSVVFLKSLAVLAKSPFTVGEYSLQIQYGL
ncbi:hypothetical protein JDS99_26485 [Bacillus cereus group sp. N6]|uniref:hypothetical protein n=1 Tax=Bacillus cereus group sp. N6 TaxID=2794583 RepID=UPI0018F76460|nr:hypothetical protein [Bacillus cereus group sp. N6]MBJ8113124.1 hypothetical protein [Bacillus cereus group sp. N6]